MKQNKGNGSKRNNVVGLVSIICWALLLTVLFNSCSSMYTDAGTVQIDYSVF